MDIKSVNSASSPFIRPLKNQQKSKAEESFKSLKTETKKSAAPTGATTFIQTVASVFYSDEILEDKKKRSLKRGKSLLDQLNQLKIELLTSDVSKETLLSLQKELNSQKMDNLPERLESILKEIETRVAVELAKYLHE
ncbi:MAG: flagellar assembly protein FliX [Proteobacteria bacterium]|nr:flagellar assembly protein FliX [Pseudomonadota bacterium]